MKYVKRDDAVHAVLHHNGQAAVASVQDLPTLDLVLCKECKHRDPEDKRCDCGGHEWVKGKILPVDDDWFCADGERKDG